MADEVIVCADCRSDFPFTESEASFFASKGLTKPRRCKPCRQKRRDAKALEGGGSAPTPVEASSRGRTQWVGGGESEAPRRDRGGYRDRKRGRHSDDHGF
jgi:Probable zinc-ribbon domain